MPTRISRWTVPTESRSLSLAWTSARCVAAAMQPANPTVTKAIRSEVISSDPLWKRLKSAMISGQTCAIVDLAADSAAITGLRSQTSVKKVRIPGYVGCDRQIIANAQIMRSESTISLRFRSTPASMRRARNNSPTIDRHSFPFEMSDPVGLCPVYGKVLDVIFIPMNAPSPVPSLVAADNSPASPTRC